MNQSIPKTLNLILKTKSPTEQKQIQAPIFASVVCRGLAFHVRNQQGSYRVALCEPVLFMPISKDHTAWRSVNH